MTIQLESEHICFTGRQQIYTHVSQATHSTMRFAIYLPPQSQTKTVPLLYWLSGLTCTEQNFITKAGAQRAASELGIAILVMDTSPRGIPYDSNDDDFGSGAGFYLNATISPWVEHYQMYRYVTEELPSIVTTHFPVQSHQAAICGHSMGGLGALQIAIKNPHYFTSVSAFAPICAPIQSQWGIKAFKGYLGSDQTYWQEYDACYLIQRHGWTGSTILIDQGTADKFLDTQLKPFLFQQACAEANVSLNLRMQDGYDHSYYFISTFIEDHIRFHLENLKRAK